MENIQVDNADIDDVKVEDEALEETPVSELINEITEKYGLSEEDDSELIDKIVKDKLDERKRLSTAIKQKRNWREKANTTKSTEVNGNKISTSQVNIDALVEQKLNEKLDSREIDSVDLSIELKSQVKNYALLNKVSIKDALKSDYIQFQIGKSKEREELDNASISNKHDRTKSNKNFKDMVPNDFDVTTEEGRKDWAEYKKHMSSIK